jgi:Coenzyme PQQ synthesis protein D (PqqD)
MASQSSVRFPMRHRTDKSTRDAGSRAEQGGEQMAEIMTRASGLDVHEVPDGYIVYQGASDSVCYLNKTAAIVFEFCDGEFRADEIVTRVAKLFDLDSTGHAEIRQCMNSLVKEGLVQSHSK